MNTAIINIKTDPEVKKAAQHIAEDLGLSLSAVVNGFLKQFVRTKAIHFSLEKNETPSPYLIQALKESEVDRKAGRVSPAFDNVEDVIRWLDTPKKDRRYANQT